MSAERPYGPVAIALHWLQAALVLGLFALGLIMVELPKGPDRSGAFALHKSLGLLALALLAVRFVWRRRHPPGVAAAGAWQEQLAAATHRLLYFLLLLAPLAGFLASTFTAYPMKFFGLPLPKLGWPDAALNAAFGAVHRGALWLLAALVALHVAGALYHALRRDRVVWRMLPRRGG